jgi:succinyl-CoA synthetase beta subunit
MMMKTDPIIAKALERGQSALSEHDSKLLMEKYGVPIAPEKLASSADESVAAAGEIGYPVVLKAEGPEISHKTERELVAVGLKDEADVREAYDRIIANLGDTPHEGVLVQKMIRGERELVIGLVRDPQFGPCVMFGLGGIFTEILKDTSFRVAPITEDDALQMMEDIKAKAILGPVRGKSPADKALLAKALVGLGTIGIEQDNVAEIDVNPLIITGEGEPVAVDALVVLTKQS